MKFSKRVESLPPYLFVEISKKIAAKKASGIEVISFGIGDPDIPTPAHIIDKLCETAKNPANHRYPESEGLPEFRKAVAEWYRKRFGVSLDPAKEVVSLIGAKEGIAHVPICFLDPGDIALVPDPGYPVYSVGTILAGGEYYLMPLAEEKGYLPDLEAIPSDILKKAKILWLNYPNNPTGAVADLDFFNSAVKFAKENNLAICHDGPYTEVAYDGYKPISFLQADGAMDVGIEFHSLSKTYNMTGWRIGMAVGNVEMIDALRRVKSNIDSGIAQAVQYMAIEALNGDQSCIERNIEVYQRRRDLLVKTLNDIGLEAKAPKAGLYIWTKVPEGHNSMSLATDLLEKVGVVVAPGIGYGKSGEGYIRLSLTISDTDMEKGITKLREWRS